MQARPRSVALVGALLASCSLLLTTTASAAPPAPPTPSIPIGGHLSVGSASDRIVAVLPTRVAATRALALRRTGLVVDPATGVTLWSDGAATAMRGASTTKLATAVTTLRVLGTTTRFPTRVVTGRKSHEVVLVAGGDPLLTSGQLSRLAGDTARALLATVPLPAVSTTAKKTPFAFTVAVDDTLYAPATLAPGWPSGYTPGVVSPVRPLVRDLRHSSDTSKDAATYFAARLTASLAALLSARHDLAPSAAYSGRLARPANATQLAVFAGNTSGAALAHMLLVSDNDTAERLFRDNAVARHRPGSWAGARATELAELTALGADMRSVSPYDGSGVSRSDRVTAQFLVSLLRLAIAPTHPELSVLRSLLPVGGVSGTLAARDGRFTTAPTRCARGKVFAKTGTLHDAIGLAGYALGSDHQLRVFAMLVVPSGHYSQLAVRRSVDVVPATLTGCY